MSIVNVKTTSGSYPIHIAPHILKQLATAIPQNTSSVVVISNPTVMGLYGDVLKASLKVCAKPLFVFEVPDGEAFKSLDTLNTIYTFLLNNKIDRKAVIIAFGGGVIGDMAGYAAASYMRGVRFIQVPTTLLAQVDSSVGGKTAVNHPLGKNMVGAFYQPIAVDIDVNVLKTLSKRDVSAGLAEIIKYGLILDKDFFKWCEENVEALYALDTDVITYAIERACELKARVVEEDEKETGLRAILNLGHTFAHAIETALGYGTWLHGEAVACGMIQAAELSAQVLGFPREDVDRIRTLVEKIGCPTSAPNLGTNKWIELMQIDKKNEQGKINFVLLPRIGEAVVRTVPSEDLGIALQKTVSNEKR